MQIDETIAARVEQYIKGQMSAAEQQDFESEINSNKAYARLVNEYVAFYSALNQYNKRLKIKAALQTAHEQMGNTVQSATSGKIIPFVKRNIRVIGIAASVACVSILSTSILLSWYYKNQAPKGYKALVNEVAQIKKSQGVLNNTINTIASATTKKAAAPGIYSGSSFLVTTNGYLITSFHIVQNANNIEVVNDGYAYNAKVIATNSACDFALLKIQDSSYEAPKVIPYNFFSNRAEMGQKVFTLGYPRTDLVYGEGSISSLTGYLDDTMAYQVSVPLNPGNSGGPLFDEQGNIIGVISGKQMRSDAASFAIKSSYIVDALRTINEDAFNENFNSNKRALAKHNRVQQIKTLKPYVFEVRVIN
jgi:serine protease Do